MVGRTEARLCMTSRPAAVRRLGPGAGAPRDAVGRRPPRRLAAVGPRPARARRRAARSTSRGCIEGNVALQVLAATTKSPRHLNIERNDDRSDDVVLLALAPRLAAARRGAGCCRGRSTWRPVPIELAAPLRRARSGSSARAATWPPTRRRAAADPRLTAGLLAIEGAHALDGDPANVEVVADAGFRMMSPSHFFDNAFGGSAHGIAKGGLTDAGREMVGRMEARGMLVDVAHASAATIDDVLAMAARPVVASHTGFRGVADNTRNLTDEHARGHRRDRRRARDRVLADGLRRRRRGGDRPRRSATPSTSPASTTSVSARTSTAPSRCRSTRPGWSLLTDALLDAGFADDDDREGHGRQRAAAARRDACRLTAACRRRAGSDQRSDEGRGTGRPVASRPAGSRPAGRSPRRSPRR